MQIQEKNVVKEPKLVIMNDVNDGDQLFPWSTCLKGKPTRSTVVWKYAGQWFLPYHVVNSHHSPYYNDLKSPGPFFFHVQYFCVLLAHTTCALSAAPPTRRIVAALMVMLSINHIIACCWFSVGARLVRWSDADLGPLQLKNLGMHGYKRGYHGYHSINGVITCHNWFITGKV